MGTESNYEIMKRQAATIFLQYDQEAMILKFHLDFDSDYLYICFFSRKFRIRRSDGLAEYQRLPWEKKQYPDSAEKWLEADFNAAMVLYDLLGYAKENCHLSGEFSVVGSLRGMENIASQPCPEEFYSRAKKIFDDNPGLLHEACRMLGGIPEGKGDIAYRIPVFPFMDALFQFWLSDDEFPAQLTIFWDKNMLMYLHYETVWYAAGYLVEQLETYVSSSGCIPAASL